MKLWGDSEATNRMWIPRTAHIQAVGQLAYFDGTDELSVVLDRPQGHCAGGYPAK